MTVKELNVERLKFKKALEKLTLSIIAFENRLDGIMKLPSNLERGKKIAELTNELTIANQSTLHFTFSYSFKKINKLYQMPVSIAL